MSAPGRAALLAAYQYAIDVAKADGRVPLPVLGAGRVTFWVPAENAPAVLAALEGAYPAEFTAYWGEKTLDLRGEYAGVPVIISAHAEDVAERKVTGTRMAPVEVVEWVRLPAGPEPAAPEEGM